MYQEQDKTDWIKVNREIMSWRLYKNPGLFHLYIHLLMTVNQTEGCWIGREIHPGQRLTSLQKLADELGATKDEIRHRLQKLEEDACISREISRNYQIITIVNYNLYQDQFYHDSVSIPPTFSDIEKYSSEHGLPCYVRMMERFIDYNQQRGWEIGKRKVTDWRPLWCEWVANDNNIYEEDESDARTQSQQYDNSDEYDRGYNDGYIYGWEECHIAEDENSPDYSWEELKEAGFDDWHDYRNYCQEIEQQRIENRKEQERQWAENQRIQQERKKEKAKEAERRYAEFYDNLSDEEQRILSSLDDPFSVPTLDEVLQYALSVRIEMKKTGSVPKWVTEWYEWNNQHNWRQYQTKSYSWKRALYYLLHLKTVPGESKFKYSLRFIKLNKNTFVNGKYKDYI